MLRKSQALRKNSISVICSTQTLRRPLFLTQFVMQMCVWYAYTLMVWWLICVALSLPLCGHSYQINGVIHNNTCISQSPGTLYDTNKSDAFDLFLILLDINVIECSKNNTLEQFTGKQVCCSSKGASFEGLVVHSSACGKGLWDCMKNIPTWAQRHYKKLWLALVAIITLGGH